MEDQRCGDVVRQVADHAQAVWHGLQLVEIEFEGVALIQAKARVTAELVLQDRHQIAVELNYVELRAAVEQAFGQRALARADLQHVLAVAGMDGAQDAVNNPGVMQEVLAKTLARAVLVFGHAAAPGFNPEV